MKKITLPIIAAALIGFILGGLIIHTIDTHRPRPLFSSANVEACEYIMDEIEETADRANYRPISEAQWTVESNHYWTLRGEYNQCGTQFCQELNDRVQFLREEVPVKIEELEIWRLNHPIPPPLSAADQQTEERLVNEIHTLAQEGLDKWEQFENECQPATTYPALREYDSGNNSCTTATARPSRFTDAKTPANKNGAGERAGTSDSTKSGDSLDQPRSGGAISNPSLIEEEQSCEDPTTNTNTNSGDPNGNNRAY